MFKTNISKKASGTLQLFLQQAFLAFLTLKKYQISIHKNSTC